MERLVLNRRFTPELDAVLAKIVERLNEDAARWRVLGLADRPDASGTTPQSDPSKPRPVAPGLGVGFVFPDVNTSASVFMSGYFLGASGGKPALAIAGASGTGVAAQVVCCSTAAPGKAFSWTNAGMLNLAVESGIALVYGDRLWLSASEAGKVTNVRPSSGGQSVGWARGNSMNGYVRAAVEIESQVQDE